MILDERVLLEDYRKKKTIDGIYMYVSLIAKECFGNKVSIEYAKEVIFKELKSKLKSEYSKTEYYDIVENVVNSIYKHEVSLKVVDCIKITKKEMDIISKREDHRDGRMLFSMLVYTKIELAKGNNGWIKNLDDMFKSVKLAGRTQEEKMSYIKPSYEDGLVKFYFDFYKASMDSSLKVCGRTTFQDKEFNKEDVLFEIDSLNNFWLYYDYYVLKDKNLKLCECCGCIIRKTSNKIKYCKDCKAYVDREKTRERVGKHRNS